MAVVAQCACNAYLAYKSNPDFAYLTHKQFKIRLAHALLTEAYIPERPRRNPAPVVDPAGFRLMLGDAMGGHHWVKGNVKRKMGHCCICGERTVM